MIEKIKYENHEEWLSIRSKYIGGSDAGAVVGLNPYKSAYALWAEKTGKVPGFEGNLTTKVGAYLEELVAKLFEEETGKKVQRMNTSIHNTDYPYAIANIDRKVIGEKALLEIKTTNSIPIMKQLRGTEFPEAYYAQVVHYLAVTGLEKAYLAVLVNCRELKIYELERDQAEIDALMGAEDAFWKLVESDTPPAVDGSDSTGDTLLSMYPASTGELKTPAHAGDKGKTLITINHRAVGNLFRQLAVSCARHQYDVLSYRVFCRQADIGHPGILRGITCQTATTGLTL